jgi:hypothetical protein
VFTLLAVFIEPIALARLSGRGSMMHDHPEYAFDRQVTRDMITVSRFQSHYSSPEWMHELQLSAEDKTKILSGNARRLRI